MVLEADEQLKLIEKFGGVEELGGFHTAPHFAAAWAHANNTPFQWGKQMASHLGGTRDPMVVAWPGHIKATAAPRSQFTHCTDIAPTVLEMIGIPEPTVVDGIEQEPMDGTSFAFTFDDADAAERHTVQYFGTPRQSRHLQGRLVGFRQTRQGPLGLQAGDAAAVRARGVTTQTRTSGSSTTCRATSARPTTWPRRTPTSSRR